jgi:pimeloyl-ACP methyl ester carboxylesterase
VNESEGGEKMKEKLFGVFISILVVAMFTLPMSAVYAKKPVVTDGDGYTQYVGTLGGANFVVRIPDDWNGMLVVGCHGYMAFNWNPNAQFAMDNLGGAGLPFALVEQGFAYAASSYGERGFAIKEAMIRTHQLTEYVIDNFGVTGKVFIIGHSMGGCIGLLLGEKYPELYDGVLDISGMRDIILGYTDSVNGIADIESIPEDIWNNMEPSLQAYLTQLLFFLKQMTADMEAALGGTYDEKPQHYEKRNPVDHAEIRIPMISVTGEDDPLSENQVYTFRDAVIETGCEEYYRLYIIESNPPPAPPAGHSTPPTINAALNHFEELVNYPDGW